MRERCTNQTFGEVEKVETHNYSKISNTYRYFISAFDNILYSGNIFCTGNSTDISAVTRMVLEVNFNNCVHPLWYYLVPNLSTEQYTNLVICRVVNARRKMVRAL